MVQFYVVDSSGEARHLIFDEFYLSWCEHSLFGLAILHEQTPSGSVNRRTGTWVWSNPGLELGVFLDWLR
jgi:hypothetical protein